MFLNSTNIITLSVTVDGTTCDKTFPIETVDPRAMDEYGRGAYAALGDNAHCPSCAHGCPACPHTTIGPILTGSPNVMIGDMPAARVGDTGVAAACCGPNTYEIIEGDPEVLIDGRPAARVGHETRHCGAHAGRIVGPFETYYVVFQATFAKVREGKMPRRREDETDAEWTRRRIKVYNALTYGDFYFEEMPLTEAPVIASFASHGRAFYPPQEFEKGSQWVLTVNASHSGVSLNGSMLLTALGVYYNNKELVRLQPEIEELEPSKTMFFNRDDGKAYIAQQGSTAWVGPLAKRAWTQGDRQDAVKLSKSLYKAFDCFIANVVYAYDQEKVRIFREFRDKVLQESDAGTHLVGLYYTYGPDYASGLRRHPEYIPLARFFLDRVASRLYRLDMEDPATREDLEPLIRVLDRLVSFFVSH